MRSRVLDGLDGVYRILLLAWPAEFRRAFGAQMREAFRDRCRDAMKRGGPDLLALLAKAVLDSLWNGLAERVSAARTRRHEGRSRRMGRVLGGRPVRQAIRRLVRAPAFALAAVSSVALGVAAFASVASVADGVLLDPLPYASPDRLVWIWRDYSWIDFPRGWLGGPDVMALREHGDVFEDVVAFRSGRANLSGMGATAPEEANVLLASDGFFDVLGARPMLGRGFEPGESLPEAEPVVVLGHDIWRRRWGSDPGLVGERILVDGEAWTVVGVMPPDFRFVKHSSLGEPEPADLYGVLRMDLASLSPGFGGFAGLARVRPGVAPAAVEAALALSAEEIDAFFGDRGLRLWAVDLRSDLIDGIAPALVALAAAGFFLLLILTANLATLQYGRAEERSRDVAIRTALGGSRSAAVAGLVVESVVVTGIGCALGLLLAWLSVDGLLSLAPGSLPRRETIDLDGSVIATTALVSLLMGVAAGLGPAIRVSGRAAAQVLRSSDPRAGGGRGARTRSTLVVVQVAMTLVLLVGAGLVGRSAVLLLRADPGFEPSGVLTWRVPLDDSSYPDDAAAARMHREYLSRVAALPGVLAAGAASSLPLSSETDQGPVSFPGAEGNSGDADADSPLVDVLTITSGYLEAMGVRVLAGRPLDAADDAEGPPIALIDRTLAERFFPAGNAVGRSLVYGTDTLSITGVVDHARMYNVYEDDRGQLYLPAARYPDHAMYYAARSDGNPLSLLAAVRSALRDLDASVPLTEARPASALVRASLGRHRLTLILLGTFAAGALLLSAMGIYGVVAGGVIRRTPEIGVRMALGANAPRILRLVAVEGARVVTIGLVLGLVGALAASRLLESLLFGVRSNDLLTYAGVAAFLFVTASVACLVPALRAVRIQPTRALRGE